MVHLRLLGEPPVAPRPRGRNLSFFELGCTPAFWILFHRDRPSGQSAYYYSEPGLIFRVPLFFFFAILTDISSAARRCHRTDVAVPWTDSCWLVERHFWQ